MADYEMPRTIWIEANDRVRREFAFAMPAQAGINVTARHAELFSCDVAFVRRDLHERAIAVAREEGVREERERVVAYLLRMAGHEGEEADGPTEEEAAAAELARDVQAGRHARADGQWGYRG